MRAALQANFHWEKSFTQTDTYQSTSSWTTTSTSSSSSTNSASHETQSSKDSNWELAVSTGFSFGVGPVDANFGTTSLAEFGVDSTRGGSESSSTTSATSSESSQAFEMTREQSSEIQNTMETSVSETYSWCVVVASLIRMR